MKIQITQQNWNSKIIDILDQSIQDVYLTLAIRERTKNFCDTGYHYIGEWNTETECWNYLQKILSPIAQNILVYSRYYDKHKNFIPTVTTKDIEKYTNTNNSNALAEIAPITEAIGNIKTPSSKTNVSGGYTTNVEKTYTNRELELLDYINTHSTLLDTVGEMIANAVISEYNTLY